MDRGAYNQCMSPYMSGQGLSKEERKLNMCVGAKLCTGKAKDEAEAQQICAEAAVEAAANPEPAKARKKSKKVDPRELATCIITELDGSGVTHDSLMKSIAVCTGQKVPKSGREAFIKQCFKENTTGNGFQYDLKEAQRLRTQCTALWKEQQEVAE